MNTFKVQVYNTLTQRYETYSDNLNLANANTISDQLGREGKNAIIECDLVYEEVHHEAREYLVTWFETLAVTAIVCLVFF